MKFIIIFLILLKNYIAILSDIFTYLFKLSKRLFAAKDTKIANGTPVTITDVWSAPIPPLAKSTIAITPSDIAQITLSTIGGSSFVFSFLAAVNIDLTQAPESEEVTKKVKKITIANPINACEKGNCSKKTKSETAISLLIAVLRELGSKNSW